MKTVERPRGAIAERVPPRAPHRVAAGLALALGGLLGAALALEIGLRFAGYRIPVLLPDSVRGTYRIAPRSRFVYFGYLPGEVEDFQNPVELNAQGFHDHDYPAERPAPSAYRILVLGDSYVAALEVPLELTFHKRLEERLAREDPLARGSYQVIALGQGRTAQETEIEWLRRYGPIYRPDVVLMLFFCGNDFMENDAMIFAEASAFGTRYITKVAPRKIRLYQKLLLFPRSHLNGLVAEAAAEYFAEHLDRFDRSIRHADLESPELGIYRNPLPPQWQAALDRTDKLLEIARHETEMMHARFVLASLSGPQGIGELAGRVLWAEAKDPRFDYERPDRWVQEWAKRHDVPLLELGRPLAAIGRGKVFWKHDQHLNPHGHAVVADLLYPFLVEQAKRQ
jgi:lysophospholipase L1-like esterase